MKKGFPNTPASSASNGNVTKPGGLRISEICPKDVLSIVDTDPATKTVLEQWLNLFTTQHYGTDILWDYYHAELRKFLEFALDHYETLESSFGQEAFMQQIRRLCIYFLDKFEYLFDISTENQKLYGLLLSVSACENDFPKKTIQKAIDASK